MPEQSLDWDQSPPYSAQSRKSGTNSSTNDQFVDSFILTEGDT